MRVPGDRQTSRPAVLTAQRDVLAVVDKDVSDLQTGRNTVVCSSVVHIFPFCALPALSCCRRTPQGPALGSCVSCVT